MMDWNREPSFKGSYLSDWYLLTRTYLFIVKRLYKRVMGRCAPELSGLVLDLGCGNQPYRPLLGHGTYLSMDISPDRRPSVVADATAIPVREAGLDSVLCTEVIEHVAEPDAVIAEIFRVLKPGGKVLLTAPMSWGLHYAPYDFWRFTHYGLRLAMERRGFRIELVERIGGLFSLIGSRLVEALSLELWHKLAWIPPKARHSLILFFSIPASILFACLGDAFDSKIQSDAIGYAVLASKPSSSTSNGENCALFASRRA